MFGLALDRLEVVAKKENEAQCHIGWKGCVIVINNTDLWNMVMCHVVNCNSQIWHLHFEAC